MNAKVAVLLTSLALLIPPGLLNASSAVNADDKIPVGLLVVFTGTKTYNSGNILYFPHTSYAIFHANGNFYRFVRNHTTPTDEDPFTIPIPAGHYFILARSENEGRVNIPITIDSGRITTFHLDDPNRKRIPPNSQKIRLKDGSVVGWHWSRRAPRGFEEGRPLINLFGWKI